MVQWVSHLALHSAYSDSIPVSVYGLRALIGVILEHLMYDPKQTKKEYKLIEKSGGNHGTVQPNNHIYIDNIATAVSNKISTLNK